MTDGETIRAGFQVGFADQGFTPRAYMDKYVLPGMEATPI